MNFVDRFFPFRRTCSSHSPICYEMDGNINWNCDSQFASKEEGKRGHLFNEIMSKLVETSTPAARLSRASFSLMYPHSYNMSSSQSYSSVVDRIRIINFLHETKKKIRTMLKGYTVERRRHVTFVRRKIKSRKNKNKKDLSRKKGVSL